MPRIRQVLLVLCTLAVGGAVPMVGQEPSFVYVSFAFQSKKAAKVFNTEQDQREAEKKIGRELAQRCKTKFRYWQFVADEPDKYPKLKFWLASKDDVYRIASTIVPGKNDPDDERWHADIFGPGDLVNSGDPTAETWPQEIVKALEIKVLPLNSEAIRKTLQEQDPL